MDKNPFVILTNVFSDYDKHLKKLQSEQSSQESSPQFQLSNTPKEATPTKIPAPSEESVKVVEPQSNSVEPEKSTSKPVFSFGSSASSQSTPFGAATTTPKWSFGSSDSSSGTGFSFKPTTSAADSTQPATGGFSFKPSATSTTTSLFGKPIGSTSFTG